MRSAILACLVPLIGCGVEPQPAETTADPLLERVVLSPLGVSLSVPPGYAVYPRGADGRGIWVVDLNPGGRQPRQIVLDPEGPDQLPEPSPRGADCPWQGPVDQLLEEGNSVRFHSSVGCGGSGGVEAVLVGVWALGSRRFALSCITQHEPGLGDDGPDPIWCLEFLGSARDVPATATPPRLGPTGSEQPPLIIAPPLAGGQTSDEPGE